MASSVEEQILRTSKEIIVKFIEVGRISPTAFPEAFKTIYTAVDETVKARQAPPPASLPPEQKIGQKNGQKDEQKGPRS